MKATIKIQGKQVTVKEGDILFVNRFVDSKAGDTVEIKEVLMVGEGADAKFGAPYVDGAKVQAKVVKNGKGKKIYVLTYKPKKNEKRKMGHRQPYTKVEITKIEA